MRKGFYILMSGIFLIFLGSFLILISSSNNTTTSGIFVIFPFVFIIGGEANSTLLIVMFLFFAVMILIPFYIFYKLSLWHYYELPEFEHQPSDTKVCPICGTILPINAKYCYNCGYAFKELD